MLNEFIPTILMLCAVTIVFIACCCAIGRAAFANSSKADVQIAFYWALVFVVLLIGCRAIGEISGDVFSTTYATGISFFALIFGVALSKSWKKAEADEADRINELLVLVEGYQKSNDSLENRCSRAARDFNLTRREEDIVNLLAQGYTRPEIARTLYVSDNTVKTHIHNLYRKLGVSDKTELIESIA